MKVRIKVTTPPGYAKGMENNPVMKFIRSFILGTKTKHSISVDEKNNFMIWDVEGDPKRVFAVTKRVHLFHGLMENIGNHKMMNKAVKMARLPPDQAVVFKDMLIHQTKIEIIRE